MDGPLVEFNNSFAKLHENEDDKLMYVKFPVWWG